MTPRPRTLLAGAGGCALAFVVLLGLAYGSDWARWVDATSLQGFLGFEGSAAEPAMHALSRLGDPLPVGLIGLALAAVAAARGRPRTALFVLVLLAVTSVSSQVLKALLAYPRYDPGIGATTVDPVAFPSGHATASMALAIALVVVVPPRLRPAAALAGTGLAIGVSFSVVALGWHFPSDVVGGYLLATGWALVLLAGLRAARALYPERNMRSRLTVRSKAVAERVAAAGIRAALVAIAVALLAAALAVLAFRLPEGVDYARDNTVFLGVAGAVSLTASALLAGLAISLTRRSD